MKGVFTNIAKYYCNEVRVEYFLNSPKPTSLILVQISHISIVKFILIDDLYYSTDFKNFLNDFQYPSTPSVVFHKALDP